MSRIPNKPSDDNSHTKEIEEILTSQSSFLKWGALVVLLVLAAAIASLFYITFPSTVGGIMTVQSSSKDSLQGRIFVGHDEIGKIKKGQKVVIDYNLYPSDTYGACNGTISGFDSIPAANGRYKVTIRSTNQSVMNRKLPVKPDMKATVTILASNHRIIDAVLKR